jgi:hypothetical protein
MHPFVSSLADLLERVPRLARCTEWLMMGDLPKRPDGDWIGVAFSLSATTFNAVCTYGNRTIPNDMLA